MDAEGRILCSESAMGGSYRESFAHEGTRELVFVGAL